MWQDQGTEFFHHATFSSLENRPCPYGSDGSSHHLRCHLGSRKEKKGGGGAFPFFKDTSRKFRYLSSLYPIDQNIVAGAHQAAMEAGNVVFVLSSHLLNWKLGIL